MKISLSIRGKLLMAAFGILLLSGTILLVFNMTSVYQKLVARLHVRGVSVANLISHEVVDLILTENFPALELLLKDRLGDEQDIEYAFVTNKGGVVVAHTFTGGFPTALHGMNQVPAGRDFSTTSYTTETKSLIDIAVPLLKGEIGQLHVGLSEASIRKETTGIIWSVTWLIFATLILSGVVFTVLASVITKPLLRLTRTADYASRGNFDVQFETSSEDEIGRLGSAFNNMIAARKQIEDEREELIVELQTALRQIKTLSGLLPICAWCKKIRDDAGYWKMIDVYVSEHSDATFTHGICPDCLREVSKETFDRLNEKENMTGDPSASQGDS